MCAVGLAQADLAQQVGLAQDDEPASSAAGSLQTDRNAEAMEIGAAAGNDAQPELLQGESPDPVLASDRQWRTRRWLALGLLAAIAGLAAKTMNPDKVRSVVLIVLAAFAARILLARPQAR